MSRGVKTPSREAQDTLRALRRAARNALELGLKTGTPVYVMRDNKIVDITKEQEGNKTRITWKSAKRTSAKQPSAKRTSAKQTPAKRTFTKRSSK